MLSSTECFADKRFHTRIRIHTHTHTHTHRRRTMHACTHTHAYNGGIILEITRDVRLSCCYMHAFNHTYTHAYIRIHEHAQAHTRKTKRTHTHMLKSQKQRRLSHAHANTHTQTIATWISKLLDIFGGHTLCSYLPWTHAYTHRQLRHGSWNYPPCFGCHVHTHNYIRKKISTDIAKQHAYKHAYTCIPKQTIATWILKSPGMFGCHAVSVGQFIFNFLSLFLVTCWFTGISEYCEYFMYYTWTYTAYAHASVVSRWCFACVSDCLWVCVFHQHVPVCIYMYVCVYVYKCVHIYTYTSLWTHPRAYICMYINM
jgi:hypothetical protein